MIRAVSGPAGTTCLEADDSAIEIDPRLPPCARLVDPEGPGSSPLAARPPGADSKVLGQLSALAQRISRNPSDPNSIQTLERLLEEIDGANAPREISDSVWRQVKDLAIQIEEALVGSSQPDESTAMDLAGRLFAILRSNV